MTELARRRRALMAAKSEQDPWEVLFRSIDAGTYATDYAIGDTIPLDLGTGGILNMQIVGFDADTLSDSASTVPVSMISVELYKTSKRFNPAYSAGTSGTGTIGGWENSELRSYMVNTIFPLIPSAVSSRIKTVKKYSDMYDTSETKVNNSLSDDKIWVPNLREIATGYSTKPGPHYSYFSAGSSSGTALRKKAKVGGSYAEWWLRDAYNTKNLYVVGATGTASSTKTASTSLAFPIGFCVG